MQYILGKFNTTGKEVSSAYRQYSQLGEMNGGANTMYTKGRRSTFSCINSFGIIEKLV